MKKNLKKLLIWLTKTGVYFFIEGSTSILFFVFQADSVKYFDIYDENKFIIQLDSFLKQNKLEETEAYFIVGQDAVIEGEFVKNNSENVAQFIDNIPYEQVITKINEKEKSVHVLGFNAAFYQTINSVIEKLGGTTLTVLPYYFFDSMKLDIQNAEVILKKAETLKSQNMIIELPKESETPGNQPFGSTQTAKKEKSTLPFLIPIFLVLILVLIFMVLKTK